MPSQLIHGEEPLARSMPRDWPSEVGRFRGVGLLIECAPLPPFAAAGRPHATVDICFSATVSGYYAVPTPAGCMASCTATVPVAVPKVPTGTAELDYRYCRLYYIFE